MKKIVIILGVLLLLFIAPASAQDTVRRADPWYCSEVSNPLGGLWRPINFWDEGYLLGFPDWLFKECVVPDSAGYLYGIAVTAYNFPIDSNRFDMAPILALYNQSIYYGENNDLWMWKLKIFDSVTVFNTRRDLYFDYELSDNKNDVIPTTELYFDIPYRLDSLPDTFHLASVWTASRKQRFMDWVTENCASSDVHDCYYDPRFARTPSLPTSLQFTYDGGVAIFSNSPITIDSVLVPNQHAPDGTYIPSGTTWGGLFPIVNLRCTAPGTMLLGREDGSATVGWWQAEAGEDYQLSIGAYGSDPDSGLIVTPIDTFYTFTGLQGDSLYNVWARKSCRYTTAGYDTLVWSDWGRPVMFRTYVGIGVAEDDSRLQVAVHDGRIRVSGLPMGRRAEVYNMKGCLLATLAADGLTPPLPQGVYMVRVAGHTTRKVVVVR